MISPDAIIRQDRINRNTPFNPETQHYPADLFILKGFDFKGQLIWERNSKWHDKDGFFIGREKISKTGDGRQS